MTNILLQKSYAFALESIRLCFQIQRSYKEYILSRQLLKAATSIGANVHEAQNAISRKEFLSKMYIAFKEARETEYRLTLILDAKIFNEEEKWIRLLLQNAGELNRLLSQITKTTKERLRSNDHSS